MWARFVDSLEVVHTRDTLLWWLWIQGVQVRWPSYLLWLVPYTPGVWWGMESHPLQMVFLRPDFPIEVYGERPLRIPSPWFFLQIPHLADARDVDGDGDVDYLLIMEGSAAVPDSQRMHGVYIVRNTTREVHRWLAAVYRNLQAYRRWLLPPSQARSLLKDVEIAIHFAGILDPDRVATLWDHRRRLLRIVRAHRALQDFRHRASPLLIAFAAGLALMFLIARSDRLRPPPDAHAIRALMETGFFHEIKYLLPAYRFGPASIRHLEKVVQETLEVLHGTGRSFAGAPLRWRRWRLIFMGKLYVFALWLRFPWWQRWFPPVRMYWWLRACRETWNQLITEPGVMADLPDIIHQAVHRFQPLHPEVHLTVRTAELFTVHCMFFSTEVRLLERLFFAFLENAAEAGARHIEVDATLTPEGPEITVLDDGEGLPEALRNLPPRERVQRMFTAGFSIRRDPRPHQGRGLTRELLELIERFGEIWVEPRDDRPGTLIVLLFRRCTQEVRSRGSDA